MKTKFSALISGLSGSSADVTASSWKGRGYIRRRVVPAYRNTAAQILVRDSFGRMPELWRSLETQIKTALNLYAVAYQMGGCNWFAKQNRKKDQTGDADFITPPNVLIDPVATLVLTDKTGGSCQIDWTGGTQSAAHKIYLLTRKVLALPYALRFTQLEKDTTLVSAFTKTLTIGASATYRVFAIVENCTLHTFSEAVSHEIIMGA